MEARCLSSLLVDSIIVSRSGETYSVAARTTLDPLSAESQASAESICRQLRIVTIGQIHDPNPGTFTVTARVTSESGFATIARCGD